MPQFTAQQVGTFQEKLKKTKNWKKTQKLTLKDIVRQSLEEIAQAKDSGAEWTEIAHLLEESSDKEKINADTIRQYFYQIASDIE